MGYAVCRKLRNDRTMSQSTKYGAGWYIGGLMGTLLAVLHPDGGAYYYFFRRLYTILHHTCCKTYRCYLISYSSFLTLFHPIESLSPLFRTRRLSKRGLWYKVPSWKRKMGKIKNVLLSKRIRRSHFWATGRGYWWYPVWCFVQMYIVLRFCVKWYIITF